MPGMTETTQPDPPIIPMSPGEVAKAFGVDIKTVSRWANAGRLTTFRTPGNHRRYSREEVERLIK